MTLRQQTKWHGACRNIEENDLVLLISNNTPRNNWLVGRVIETYSGPDGLVRSARVRLKDTELVRPITKLCILEEARGTAQETDQETHNVDNDNVRDFTKCNKEIASSC